jgi:hypothetical protein
VGVLVPADRALATGTASLDRVTELVHRLAGSARVAGRSLGYEVVRLTWPDLERPSRVEALVRSALERVAARHTRPAP